MLAEVVAGWCEKKTPVVMTRMVDSDIGWKAAPYLSVPACFSSIGEQLASVGDSIRITPGLCVSHSDNHNVMRGEETQLIGMRNLAPPSLYVIPGTHCRWVRADSRQINDFHTAMIGELHHLLLNHSLIGAGLSPQENSINAFTVGLERGPNTSAILPQLFEVRASHVLGTFPYEQVSEFFPGLSIGAEVASVRDYVAHQRAITLVAGTSPTARYQQTFQAMGCDVAAMAGDTASRAGIRSVAHVMAN